MQVPFFFGVWILYIWLFFVQDSSACEFSCESYAIVLLQWVAVGCVVVQCGAVCCSVLQCAAVGFIVLQCVAACWPSLTSSGVVCCSVLQCVTVCCSVSQCVAVCCSVLQCVAACWLSLMRCWPAQPCRSLFCPPFSLCVYVFVCICVFACRLPAQSCTCNYCFSFCVYRTLSQHILSQYMQYIYTS